MKNDEFAFFNQQLAAMLRDGIPLEGALQRLSADMKKGALRSEMELLAADLAKGIPLREAARARQFPDLYRHLLEVGAQSNDLPAVLTLVADYYQRRHAIWTRLKGLMVYPAIVLFCAFLLSCFISVMLSRLFHATFGELSDWFRKGPPPYVGTWIAPVLLGLALAAFLAAVTAPSLRRFLRWRLPACKEASLAQVGCSMSLMLKSGVPLDEALALVEQLEKGTPAEMEISSWRGKLSSGRGKFTEMASDGKVFPPLFVWMVGHGGEDLGAGFQRASEIYQSRATFRTEILLYSALPCAIVALGIIIAAQIQPLLQLFINMMQGIGDAW